MSSGHVRAWNAFEGTYPADQQSGDRVGVLRMGFSVQVFQGRHKIVAGVSSADINARARLLAHTRTTNPESIKKSMQRRLLSSMEYTSDNQPPANLLISLPLLLFHFYYYFYFAKNELLEDSHRENRSQNEFIFDTTNLCFRSLTSHCSIFFLC